MTKPKTKLVTALARLMLQDSSIIEERHADDLREGEADDLLGKGLAEEGDKNALRRRSDPPPEAEPEAPLALTPAGAPATDAALAAESGKGR